jgi:cytochrome c oxidase assembly factor CtaG
VRHLLTPLGRDPYLTVLVLAGSVLAIYYSPMLEWSVRSQFGYGVTTLLALLAGCLFTRAMTVTGDGDNRPSLRLRLLAAAAAVYAVIGWWLWSAGFTSDIPWTTALSQPPGAPAGSFAGPGGALMWFIAAVTLDHRPHDDGCRRPGLPARCPDEWRLVAWFRH